jgi:2-amino-4-hydroxy-6-hydroxymethyldihydropteridine diphosphokinase
VAQDKIPSGPVTALVALGANLPAPSGPPAETLRRGLAALDGPEMRLVAASRLYATPCMPPGAGPDYVNAVAMVETALTPAATMARLHAIEAAHGRERLDRWGARTLDLDLLDHAGAVLPDAATWARWADLPEEARRAATPDRLVLPHPRLTERAFVLVPLAEIAPDWRHPVLDRRAADLVADLGPADRAAIRPLDPAGGLAIRAVRR